MSITKRVDGDVEITTITGADLEAFKKQCKDALGPTLPGHCVVCKEPFSDENVFTPAGWGETKISQTCEKCWDDMWKEEDEDG